MPLQRVKKLPVSLKNIRKAMFIVFSIVAFNLSFGEHLVHIGAVENGVAPFGIGLEQVNATLLTNLLAVNLEVFWDEASASIVFPKGICLSLSQGNLDKP